MRYISILVVIFLILSCSKDAQVIHYLPLLNDIPKDEYYDQGIFHDQRELYGTWEVIETYGTFTGNGYPKDFDQLLLKSNGIFGIVRNGDLITYGKVERFSFQEFNFVVSFVPEKKPTPRICGYSNWVDIKSDTLYLTQLAMDGAGTMFKKIR